MKKDYLWDRSGEPDPEVERLENLLRPFRYDRPAPEFPEIPVAEPRRRLSIRRSLGFRPVHIALALASLVIAVGAGLWLLQHRLAYDVISLKGSPSVDASRIGGSGLLRVGQWLETDATSRARIQVGEIGRVDVEPNTRIGLVSAQAGEHRLSLQRGKIHALILAPPRSFFVNIPSAQAVDLGCSYTLEVDEDGSGRLRVNSGWVAFELRGRESFVPAGAMSLTRPGAGPGTPFQENASASFRSALENLDFGSSDDGARTAALSAVLAESRAEDAVTLWHLLVRVSDAERPRVYARLADLAPPPQGVTQEGVLRRDRRMLDLWWNELGFGDMKVWREWERPWPSRK